MELRKSIHSLKVYIEDKIKESKLLRGLIESRGRDYDYFIDVSSKHGPIRMFKNRGNAQGSLAMGRLQIKNPQIRIICMKG